MSFLSTSHANEFGLSVIRAEMFRWFAKSCPVALTIVLAASCWIPQGTAGTLPPQPKEALSVPWAVPDSIGVAMRGTVPVSARLEGTVSVKNAEPSPWWESSFFSALLGAIVGATIGGLFLLIGQTADARRKRWQLHRDSLASLERRCGDYLNQIISERRLAGAAMQAAEAKAVSWRFPRVIAVEPRFTMDIIDLDLNVRVAKLNAELRLYNRDVEDLVRAREGLQPAYLEGKVPDDLWHRVMASQVREWSDMIPHLDAVDEMVRDINVRAVLLVEQFDSKQATRQRRYGLGSMKTTPLTQDVVDRERQSFEAERARLLEATRAMLSTRYGDSGAGPSVGGGGGRVPATPSYR